MKTHLDFLEFRLLVALGALPALACGGVAERDRSASGSGGSEAPAAGGAPTGSSGSGPVEGKGGAPSASSGSGIIGGFPQGGAAAGGAWTGTGGTVSIGGASGGSGGDLCGKGYWLEGKGSGFYACSRGFVHRPFIGQCSGGPTCVTDADCGVGAVCLCAETGSMCVRAYCTTDAECGPGGLCTTNYPEYCYTPSAFACHFPDDACIGNRDCMAGMCEIYPPMGPACTICEGRPFLVDDVARVASSVARADWIDDAAGAADIDAGELAASLRERLAEAWTRTALMEHASIAAFARFALELLSLGAPPDLICDATAAMGDESEHARLAFAAASAYAGRPLGPGPLAIAGCLDSMSPLDIVLRTIREGCIGETVAAVEAAEAACHANDPAVRRLWRKIAEDETRHAELAWRFVRWALSNLDADVRRTAHAEFERQIASAAPATSANDDALRAHGILSDNDRVAVRSAVLTGVVARAASTLFDLVARPEIGCTQSLSTG